MINVHGLRRNVKNVVKNYSEVQIKVREATSNDPWGPSGTLMREISDLTYNVVAFSEIMQVIWKRLNDHGKNWKHVYKALVLLEYLIKTGSEKVTQQCKENIFAIQTLKDFQYFEESKDQGVNVREKAKQLVALLKDEDRLKTERARALKARERFAQSSAYVKQEPINKNYGSNEFNHNSFDEDMLSPSALSMSELEHARPQTAGEEELQLQLALAMSKEEADQAERLKRNDDLRLQMALSESKEEFKKCQTEKKSEPTTSAMDDLLGLSLDSNTNGGAQVPVLDPWGLNAAPLKKNMPSDDNIWNSQLIPEKNQNLINNDPWHPTLVTSNDNNLNSNQAMLNQENDCNKTFDMNGMRKSLSADISNREGTPALDTIFGPDDNLVNFDTAQRSRTLGNPFQAAKPSSMTINELRAQNGSQNFPPFNGLSTSTSIPLQNNLCVSNASFFSQTKSSSQNPFM